MCQCEGRFIVERGAITWAGNVLYSVKTPGDCPPHWCLNWKRGRISVNVVSGKICADPVSNLPVGDVVPYWNNLSCHIRTWNEVSSTIDDENLRQLCCWSVKNYLLERRSSERDSEVPGLLKLNNKNRVLTSKSWWDTRTCKETAWTFTSTSVGRGLMISDSRMWRFVYVPAY